MSRKNYSDALEEHDRKVVIGVKTITNLRFKKDIDALAEEELALVEKYRQELHKVYNGDKCLKGQTNDKQCQWHPEEDQGLRIKA